MGTKITQDTSVDQSLLNGLYEELIRSRQQTQALAKDIDDIKNHKAKIEIDDSGLKIGKKSVDRFKEDISNDLNPTKQQIFDSKTIQKEINALINNLESAYNKVDINGKRLTESQTEQFIKSFLTIEKYGDYFGKDLTSKYQSIFDNIINNMTTNDLSKVFGEISNNALESIKSSLGGNFVEDFIKNNMYYIKDEIASTMAKAAYDVNEKNREEIELTKNTLRAAEEEKREEIRKTQEVIQGMFDAFNANRKEDEVFNIDLAKFGEIQNVFRELIKLLDEADIDTEKLTDSFQRFTKGVYVPQDQLDTAKQSLSDTIAEVDRLREEVARLQLILYTTPSEDAFNNLLKEYEDAQTKIEQLTSSLNYFMNIANSGYTSSEYQHMVDEASHFVAEWRNAQQELANVKQQLAEIKAERDKLIEEREQLKNVRENINQDTSSIGSNISTKFKSGDLKNFIDLLQQIESHLQSIREAFGSVDDNSGFKNIIDSITILLEKLSDMQSRMDSGIFNVTVNKTGVSAADTVVNEELSHLMDKYNEFMSIFGGESNLFNTLTAYGSTNIDFEKYYSSSALKDIIDPLQKVNRLQEFFKDIQMAISDLKGIKKILNADAKSLREELKGLESNSDAYDFFNSENGQSMAKNAISEAKGRLKSINSLLKMLRTAEKFETPDSSSEELSQKIKNANMNLLDEEDLEGLDKVVQKLEEIRLKLEEICNNNLLSESIGNVSTKLDDVISKFDNIISKIEVINNNSISPNNINTVTSSGEQTADSVDKENEKFKVVAQSAKEAAISKEEFVKANMQADSTANSTTNSVSQEAEAFGNASEKANELSKSERELNEVHSEADISAEATRNWIEELEKAESKTKTSKKELRELYKTFKNQDAGSSLELLSNEMQKLADEEKKARIEAEKLEKAQKKAREKAEKEALANQIFNNNLETQKNKINGKKVNTNQKYTYSSGLNNEIAEVNKEISRLKEELNNIKTPEKLREWKSEFETLNAKITNVNNKIKEEENAFKAAEAAAKKASETSQREAEKQAKAEESLVSKRSALLKRLSSLMRNGGIMKDNQWGSYIESQFDLISSGAKMSAEEIKAVNLELDQIEAKANATGKSGMTLFQMITQRAKSLIAYLSTFASFYRIVGYIRSAMQTLMDLDTQLIDLRKTTQMNVAELNEFYRASTDIGKQLGVTTSEIISQAAAWSRLGYNTKEATEQMAALSSKFASISPGVEVDNATDYLVSTMQAFKVAPEEVERTIMDNINAIGNTMATTNGEIGEMLERSSAAMKAANNTLEETIALEAAAVEITRNAETTGTAFRTISMRIRGYDEETEELSEDLADISGEIADLTKTSKNAPISIFTDDTKQTYKSTYQILKEIADIWENLTDKQQAGLLEKLGGKRGAQSLAGILADFSSVEDALKTMEEAGGSAEREMSIIRESLDFKVNALKQTWVGILQDLVDRGDIGKLVDGLIKVSEALGNILSQTGLLKTAFIGLSTIIGSRRLNLFDYTKGNGLTVGNVKVFDIFKNINGINGKEIMAQGENQHFVDLIEKSGINSPSMIDKLGNTYNAHPALVQACKDWENLGDEIKNTTTRSEYFISQNQTGFQKLGGALATFSGGLKNIAGNIAKMFLNGLASAGISFLISKTIQGIYTLYDNWAHKAEKAKEAADEAKQTIKETNDALANAQKTISSVKDRYAELAQEVRNLGTVEQNQGNLSNEEYQEFLDISNQLAELYPTLTSNYDENGNAILDLSGDVDTIVGSLNDLVDTQEKLANTEVLNSMDKIWTDYNNNLTSAKEKMDELKAEYNGTEYSYSRNFNQQYQDFLDVLNANGYVREQDTSDIGYTARAFERAGLNINEYLSYNSRTGEHGFDFSSLSEQQVEDIKNAFANMKSEYLAQVKGYEDSVTQANKEIGKYISQSMKTVDYYDSLSEAEQKIMDNLLLNLDYSKLQEKHHGDWNGVFEEVQNQFRNSFSKISDEDREAIQNYYKELFEPNEDGTEKTIAQIRELAKNIVAILGGEFSEFDILEALGLGGRIDKAQKQKERLGYKTNVSGYNDAMRNKEVSDFVDNLNDKEIDILASLNIDDYKSIAEIKDAIAKMQEVADTDKVKVTTSVDAVDSIAAAKEAITSLDDLWQETVQNRIKLGKDKKYADENGNVTKQLDEKGQAIGYADSALINSVESAFKGIAEEDSKVSLALSEFEKTLVEIPGDADSAQKAIDNLITAYIDQTSIIQNLTEENKDWSIAQLEAMGVTNAEDVVLSRLNKHVKETQKAIASLADTLYRYNDAIAKGKDGTEELAGVTDLVTQALTMYDENDNAITPVINDEFIQKHMDDIQAMAAGDVEAFSRVRAEAAKGAVLEVTTNVPTDVAEKQIQELMDQVMKLDAMNIEVGADIDDSAFIEALNNMIKSGKYTADQVSAALEGMGYEAQWVPNRYQATVATAILSTKDPTSYTTADIQMAKGVQMLSQTATMDVPSLRIISKKAGGGGGVGAHYGGGSGGSSSGGSGGGGGGGGGGSDAKEPNKPKQEAEETFDWIEVAIKRIEEEIARLDKVVGNSYDLWTHRNSALLKELEKTKEEIKAQQIAQSEYLRNANAVKVNNGKGLNPDDYGENDELVKAADQKLLDAAKKAWATGEYQKKVREGLMTGNDIEKIQNHFLADAIKEYQELYEKAVAAGDSVQDLKIKLGDLAKTNFDQAKTQAEEALSYFESYAELIDARISRTEEKGYFVSKQYYKDLLSNEKKSLSTLQNEYNTLIKKRDEAVAQGYISASSEEWHSLNQEILGVAKSIEEATTKLVEYNNQMRQIDWDVFDYGQERIGKLNEEFDFLIDLLDNQKLYDDYGLFNSRGWSDAALHASKYNVYMQQSLDYAKERAKVEKELAKDPANKNLIERREELIKLQQESIQNAYSEKEAIKSLVEEGINIHLQKMQELIDKYKKSLHESRDLYSYQQNIAKQTENITSLQKQLAAYQGDNSEEARATIQRLQKNLKDAQQQLKETQWDKYISETEKFLDDMYEDYSETLNKKLDDIDALVGEVIDEVNTRGTEINKTVSAVSKDVAYTMTENAKTTLTGTSNMVSDFKKKFENYSTDVQAAIGDIKGYISEIRDKQVAEAVDASKVQSASRVKYNAVYNGVDYNGIFDLNYYMSHNKDLQAAFGNDYDKYLEHFVNYGMKEGRQASDTFNVGYYKSHYKDLQKAYGNDTKKYYEHFLRYGMKEGRVASDTFNVSVYKKLYKDLQKAYGNDLKKYYEHFNKYGITEGRKGYAKGSHRISSNQMAWTNENGSELIYRSTDGAILTPLTQGSMVFTHEMAENLWKLSQFKVAPSGVSGSGTARTVTNNNAIAINLPNVTNYEQFKTALQNDPKMTQFIQQITLGEANGKAKLNKRKF